MVNLNETLQLKLSKYTTVLLFTLVLALIIRLYFFNGLNWDDDPDYVWRAHQVKTGKGFIYRDNNGFRIGTYYPVAITYAIFGINDFGCGSYALAISLLSVVAVFYLGKLLFNTYTGFIAALLLAFYPLDVELASRLMPDGLLSGFSLFTIYFLYKGDIKNRNSEHGTLKSIWSYIASGLLLGWCTLVNMSAVVIITYVAIYFFFSIFFFWKKIKKVGILRGFIKIVALRYVILVGAFLLVAFIEGVSYYRSTGDFLFKYNHTLTHYAGDHAFNKDLTMYPKIMFHVNSQGKFHFQGKENSYYGFYYIFTLLALIYGLTQFKRNAYFFNIWLLTVFLYLQWGSMSFTEYNPLHRLPRHLSLVTPPMILCLAFFIGNFRPQLIRKFISPIILSFLVISSSIFCYYRHQSLEDSVLPQAAIHNYLDFLKPKLVYAANSTLAYQKFLDKFKNKGRQYIDIRRAKYNRQEDAYAIVGEYRHWREVVQTALPNPSNPPANWELERVLEVEGKLQRPPYKVKIYKLLTIPIPELEIKKTKITEQFLLREFPDVFKHNSKLILSWECAQLDGIDKLKLKDNQLTLQHIEFNYPKEINYKVFTPIPKNENLRYRIIKEQGRGEVRIDEFPTEKNNFTLIIKIDDGPFPSYDFYRFFVIADRNFIK
jgi:4-amino-4-deoxy-L-arabinose transferase-like glycosyltransferase